MKNETGYIKITGINPVVMAMMWRFPKTTSQISGGKYSRLCDDVCISFARVGE